MEQYYNNQQPTIYISNASENESSEKTLKVLSVILRVIGIILGVICIFAGIIAAAIGEANTLAVIAAFFVGVLVWFILEIYASLIKVFANISMSLKDITKLLNR